MDTARPTFLWLTALLPVVLLAACQESSQSPPARPDVPLDEDRRREGILGPVDLIYVCGNRFLLTNSTDSIVEVEYRVLGSSEAGPGGRTKTRFGWCSRVSPSRGRPRGT